MIEVLTLKQRACNIHGCVSEYVFGNLPEMPEDFKNVDFMVENNQFLINENFTEGVPDENYYLQPEFYPTWDGNIDIYIKKEVEKPAKAIVVYPKDIILTNVNPGDNLLAVTYFHSGWGVKEYQGTQLVIVISESGDDSTGSFSVNQDPDEVKKFFKLEFLHSNIFLLEPNYPSFKPGWVKKVKLSIHVEKGTPPGKYLIGITPIKPPFDVAEKWLKDYPSYKSVEESEIGRPSFRIFIEVI